MIPRPESEEGARHNPGRWICNKRPEKCNGLFWVYGQAMPCPLRAKCFWGRRNIYEWSLGERVAGRYPSLDTDVEWRRRHGTRLMELKRVFTPEQTRQISTPERRERNAAWMREHRRREGEAKAQTLGILPRKKLLPCGEDCEGGCPYDGPCPYTDADTDHLEDQEREERVRAQDRAKKAREKAREAVDPEYREHRRQLDIARCHRYYEAHKDELRAKARERQRLRRKKQNRKEEML